MKRARTMLASLALAGLLAATAPAAGQMMQVDRLFQALKQTEDPSEAKALEALIWAYWFSYAGSDPEIPALMQQGRAAMDAGDLALAERLFTRIIERDPTFAEGWNRRATARYMAGDPVGSIADIRRVLALEPRHFGALSGLGLCLVALDRPEEALAAFEEALAINPHMPGVYNNILRLRQRLDGERT